ncbi:MAG: hypothetical protein JOZ39_01485, partial [Chloroflexi bacterium]|nr:hypothetical protein [Chloroflexota bacterium]
MSMKEAPAAAPDPEVLGAALDAVVDAGAVDAEALPALDPEVAGAALDAAAEALGFELAGA